ncbi:hypothetical protein P7C73_g2296, partial [Tremellales sp. Uapishka_1]
MSRYLFVPIAVLSLLRLVRADNSFVGCYSNVPDDNIGLGPTYDSAADCATECALLTSEGDNYYYSFYTSNDQVCYCAPDAAKASLLVAGNADACGSGVYDSRALLTTFDPYANPCVNNLNPVTFSTIDSPKDCFAMCASNTFAALEVTSVGRGTSWDLPLSFG